MDKKILYEQPLNERIRTFLRLEALFAQARHYLRSDSIWDSRQTLDIMIAILTIFERGDLKSETIKELERHTANLIRLQETPAVDSVKLQQVLTTLQTHAEKLQKMMGRFGQRLKDHELIAGIRQRISIPGGSCNFDMPSYHYWLQQPAQQRAQYLTDWLDEFTLIEEAVSLLLQLTRESSASQTVQAVSGFYQKPLEAHNPCQLVRVLLSSQVQAFPEISGGKHRISIRFLHASPENRPTQIDYDVDFQLTCCVI